MLNFFEQKSVKIFIMAIHSIVLIISLIVWIEMLFTMFERNWRDNTFIEILLTPIVNLFMFFYGVVTLPWDLSEQNINFILGSLPFIILFFLPFIPTLILYFIYGKLIILPWKIFSRPENYFG